jgi:hypothetical protein
MKKVANITMHAINNYGSVFQTLATEKLIEMCECEPITIDYIPASAQPTSISQIIATKGDSLILKLKKILAFLLPHKGNLANVLDDFRKKNLHLTPLKYHSVDELISNPPEADIYCAGSDQTWNTVCQGEVSDAFFLGFVPKGKRKIAFSSSFGISKLPEQDCKAVYDRLSEFYAISVREKTGIDILNNLGLKGQLVLDPTIAIGREFWDKMADPRMFEQGYLLVYQLNRSHSFTKYMKEFARRNNLYIVQIRSRKDTNLENGIWLNDVTPEQLLSLFKYSKKVLTDSFHATVFSLMFHCDFIDIYPPDFSTRLESILQMTGLQSRHVTDFNRFDYSDNPIDYNRVDAILQSERERTITFLKEALS